MTSDKILLPIVTGGIGYHHCHGKSSYGNFLDLGLIGYCIDKVGLPAYSQDFEMKDRK